MIDYGRQRSTIEPEPTEMTEEKVFVYSDITEISEEGTDEQEGFTGYEFTLTEYSKDEYIILLAEENKALAKENKALAKESTDMQIALCEVYEMIS